MQKQFQVRVGATQEVKEPQGTSTHLNYASLKCSLHHQSLDAAQSLENLVRQHLFYVIVLSVVQMWGKVVIASQNQRSIEHRDKAVGNVRRQGQNQSQVLPAAQEYELSQML